MHKNEAKFGKLIAAQDLQLVQLASCAKLTQDTMKTIHQFQRNEDELRHKIELTMREVEISTLKRKLLAAEDMLMPKSDESIHDSEKATDKDEEERIASLTRELKIAQLMIQIRDVEMNAIRELIQDINDTAILERNSILEHDIQTQKQKFHKLIDSILHSTKSLQTLSSGIQQADEVRRLHSMLNCPSDDYHKANLQRVKKRNSRERSPHSVKPLGNLASGLLESLNQNLADESINSQGFLRSNLATPIPSSVVPIPRNVNSVLPKKTYLENAAVNNRQKESFITANVVQPSAPVIDKAEKVDRLPSIASLMPENTLDSSVKSTSPPDYALYSNSPENTSSLDLLSSVCPSPVPSSTTLNSKKNEESLVTNKLPPIKIPISKLSIPYNNNNNNNNTSNAPTTTTTTTTTTATTTKRPPTELIDSKKVNDPFAYKRLRTFVKFRPDETK